MIRIPTLIYTLLIVGLFMLARDRNIKTSGALWFSVLWFSIAGSRSLGQWLGLTPSGSAEQTYLEGSPFDRDVLAVLILLGIAVLIKRGPAVGALLRANPAVMLYFIYCCSSILWSDFPDVAFKRWSRTAGDLVMVLIVLTEKDQYAAIKRFLLRPAFVLLPLSVLFIKYIPDLGRSAPSRWEGTISYTGVTNDKNMLGKLLLIVGIGVLWSFSRLVRDRVHPRNKKPILAHAIVLLMLAWLFYMAHSATSMSCFILGGGLMLLTYSPKVMRARKMLPLLMAGVVSVAYCAEFVFKDLLTVVGRDPTLTGRTAVWAAVLSLSARSPILGTGYESFWLGPRLSEMWDIFWWHPIEAHNGYIEVYLNLGLVGLVLLGFLIITGYKNVTAAFRQDPDTGRLKVALFTITLIYNFTEADFKMMAVTWIAFLLAITRVPKSVESRSSELTMPAYRRYPANKLPRPAFSRQFVAGLLRPVRNLIQFGLNLNLSSCAPLTGANSPL